MAAIDTAILRTLLASAKGAQGTRIQVSDSLEEVADLLDSLDAGTLELILQSLAVDDLAYGAGWNGSLLVPTRNAVYDEMQTKAKVLTYAGGTFSGGVFSTASATAVSVTTTEVAITVASGEKLDITVDGLYSHSAANGDVILVLAEDTTGQTFEYPFKAYRANTGGLDSCFSIRRQITGTAGSRTYRLRARTSSGTAYISIRGFTIIRHPA
jgi:hypothetical protein